MPLLKLSDSSGKYWHGSYHLSQPGCAPSTRSIYSIAQLASCARMHIAEDAVLCACEEV